MVQLSLQFKPLSYNIHMDRNFNVVKLAGSFGTLMVYTAPVKLNQCLKGAEIFMLRAKIKKADVFNRKIF